ncbi:hypothetical protein C8R46DRAFT_1215605 [Mycena filopes]|nr:hypothetical protein C8R46DRAFT_1215605 [Mycena filopes]
MALTFSDLVYAVDSIQAVRSGVLAVYWVALYEWVAALPGEVELIYPSRWNSIKVAYLLCRYYPLLVWPLVIFGYAADHSAHTCAKWTHIISSVLLPMQIFGPGVMLMRAYAFTGASIRVLVLLLTFYATLVGVSIWFFCFDVRPLGDFAYEILDGTGCFPDYSAPHAAMRLVLTMCASIGMDLISLAVIAIYCIRTRSTRGSFGRTFINQGFGAFLAVSTTHGSALGAYFSPQYFHNGVGLPYMLVIPNIIACRLILELRRKALPTETEIWRQNSIIVERAFEDPELSDIPLANVLYFRTPTICNN